MLNFLNKRPGFELAALVGAAILVVSGGSRADPRTPPAVPGLPAPFLGVAVVGSGGLTTAIDAYGDVVDLRAPGPAGRVVIAVPAERQAAGTVPGDSGIVPRVSVSGGPPRPLWRADSVQQGYLPGTNVLRTVAAFGPTRVEIDYVARGGRLACVTGPHGLGKRTGVEVGRNPTGGGGRISCNDRAAQRIVRSAARADRRWVARARPLGAAAPEWARGMYVRSLLVLRALADRRTGAVIAGARDGWAYVWPRDASAAAIALASAGYRPEARRIVRFLLGLDLGAAARFRGTGEPVGGRAAQGDAAGWVAVATQAAGLSTKKSPDRITRTNRHVEVAMGRGLVPATEAWAGRADYQEGPPGNYLGNAIASGALISIDEPKTPAWRRKSTRWWESLRAAFRPPRIMAAFGTPRGLVREAGNPASGLDSAAAWAVRPFPLRVLFPLVRRTLHRLVARAGAFGITPGEGWPGEDPWTAPTAWTAWSLAALSDSERRAGSRRAARSDRRAALRLMGDLRRAATPLGMLPERVGARTGLPRSTTPLAWSHAFAILALRQLWPEHPD